MKDTEDVASKGVPPADRLRLIDTWRLLLASAGGQAPRLRASLAGACLAAALQGLGLACLLPLIPVLLGPGGWSDGLPWLTAMTTLLIVSSCVRWWSQGFDFGGHMADSTHALRTALGQKLRRIPLEVLQSHRSGSTNAAVLGHVDEAFGYVMTVADMLAQAVIVPLIVSIGVLCYDWVTAMVLLTLLATLIPFYRRQRPHSAKSMSALIGANAGSSADVLEYVQGLAALRAACCTGQRAERLHQGFRHVEQVQIDSQRNHVGRQLGATSLVEMGVLLAVAVGASRVVSGALDVNVLAALMVLAVRFTDPLANVLSYVKVIELIETALVQVDRLLNIPDLPRLAFCGNPKSFELRLESATFRYQGALEDTVRSVSLAFPPNTLTAIVGPSGSGKTTLIRLLQRQADPQQGCVTLGEKDLRSLPSSCIDDAISVVFQDVYLFDDTILANIRMSRPQASDAEVMAAAKAAHCHDFISRLPAGYLTRVGEIGGRLSGGERQRISIARAMLKDSTIVILDESSAALDTESEAMVQQAIEALVKARTVIVIAHRLAAVSRAHRIVVLDAGRVIEQGTHGTLMEMGGKYRGMWHAQYPNGAWLAARQGPLADEPNRGRGG